MSKLELTLELDKKEVVYWESLPVKVILKNCGEEPKVVIVGPTSPIAFELRGSKDDAIIKVLSQAERNDRLQLGREPVEEEMWEEKISPGKTKNYDEDPVLCAMGGIVPGAYQLVGKMYVEGKLVKSQPIDIEIKPAYITKFTSVYSRYQNIIATTFDHTNPDGSIEVFQKETLLHKPWAGVFYQRKRLETSSAINDLAIATDATSGCNGRWVVWLDKKQIGALCGWDKSTAAEVLKQNIELENAKLIKPGYQFGIDPNLYKICTAVFFIVGTDNHKACIQSCRLSGSSIEFGPKEFLSNSIVQNIVVQQIGSSDNPNFIIVWSELSGTFTRICKRTFLKDSWAEQTTLLYERESTLLALEMAPLRAESNNRVHALFGPEEIQLPNNRTCNQLFYARICPADKAIPVELFALPLPMEDIQSWAISGYDSAKLIVLAQSNNRILYTTAGTTMGWEELIGSSPDKSSELKNVRIAATSRPEGWFPLWIDSKIGLKFE